MLMGALQVANASPFQAGVGECVCVCVGGDLLRLHMKGRARQKGL